MSLWTKYSEIACTDDPPSSLSIIQDIHKTNRRDLFLMKLRLEFENVHSNLMSQVPTPSLDTCLGDLLHEEQRLITQTLLSQTLLGGQLMLLMLKRVNLKAEI